MKNAYEAVVVAEGRAREEQATMFIYREGDSYYVRSADQGVPRGAALVIKVDADGEIDESLYECE